MIAERVLMGLLLGGVAVGCAFVLYPFISAILWAGILVFCSWPLFARLRAARIPRVAAAVIMIVLSAIVLVLPVAIAVPGGANDVDHLHVVVQNALAGGLPLAPAWLARVPLIGATVAGLWDSWAIDISEMVTFFKPYFGAIAELGFSMLLGIVNGIVGIVLALFISFFFYLYGNSMARRLRAIICRVAGDQAERLIDVTGRTVRGTVYGILGTAVVQGLLTCFGLWLSGVPRAGLLALMTGFLSVLPIGAPVVWIPAALWLLTSGKTAWGIFLGVYGVVAISGSDHLIRPYFIARGAHLPFLLTVLGVLGGALAFGLLGIFLGPVLLGVGFTLVSEFAEPGGSKTRGFSPVSTNQRSQQRRSL
ncbi:MAG: AI-2E family transporter [Acidisphaera sp.]|nr:AI-2E family transporter [Acidisphaera sp.]